MQRTLAAVSFDLEGVLQRPDMFQTSPDRVLFISDLEMIVRLAAEAYQTHIAGISSSKSCFLTLLKVRPKTSATLLTLRSATRRPCHVSGLAHSNGLFWTFNDHGESTVALPLSS